VPGGEEGIFWGRGRSGESSSAREEVSTGMGERSRSCGEMGEGGDGKSSAESEESVSSSTDRSCEAIKKEKMRNHWEDKTDKRQMRDKMKRARKGGLCREEELRDTLVFLSLEIPQVYPASPNSTLR
jgi:hypothetical protein